MQNNALLPDIITLFRHDLESANTWHHSQLSELIESRDLNVFSPVQNNPQQTKHGCVFTFTLPLRHSSASQDPTRTRKQYKYVNEERNSIGLGHKRSYSKIKIKKKDDRELNTQTIRRIGNALRVRYHDEKPNW